MKIPGEPEFPNNDKPDIAEGLPKEFTKKDYDRQRATDEEMFRRQEMIASYKTIAPNVTMSQCKEFLEGEGISVSIATISRDVKEIEDRSWQWSDRLAMSGFVWSCQEAVQRNDNLISILSKELAKAGDAELDASEKALMARTINELQMSKLNLQGRATYQRLKKARDKYMSAEALSNELRRQ